MVSGIFFTFIFCTVVIVKVVAVAVLKRQGPVTSVSPSPPALTLLFSWLLSFKHQQSDWLAPHLPRSFLRSNLPTMCGNNGPRWKREKVPDHKVIPLLFSLGVPHILTLRLCAPTV